CLTPALKTLTEWFGLAFGLGLSRKIAQAYTYLTDLWEAKDRVFLFGFSRGAYSSFRLDSSSSVSAKKMILNSLAVSILERSILCILSGRSRPEKQTDENSGNQRTPIRYPNRAACRPCQSSLLPTLG